MHGVFSASGVRCHGDKAAGLTKAGSVLAATSQSQNLILSRKDRGAPMKLHPNTWLSSAVAIVALAAGASAQVPFTDNFDSYAVGSIISSPSQGGWTQWNNAACNLNKIEDSSTGFARSGHSVSGDMVITPFDCSDLVHTFTGYTTGQHTLRVYSYLPTGSTDSAYFLILNKYPAAAAMDWSVQLTMDPNTATWACDHGTTTPTNGVLLLDTWVECRAQIDLTANMVEVFYNGVACAAPYSWTGGVFGGGTNPVNLACV